MQKMNKCKIKYKTESRQGKKCSAGLKKKRKKQEKREKKAQKIRKK